MVALMLITNIGDMRESEIKHHDLDEARESSGYHLRPEHGSRRNLHVVSEFQVCYEIERLGPVRKISSSLR